MLTLTTRATYRVDHSAITNMTLNPNGMVAAMTRRVAGDIRETAGNITRRETGKRGYPRTASRLPMWAQYHAAPERLTPTNVVWRVSNTSGHAIFVLKGTRPTITSTRGKLMPVGKSQMGLHGAAKVPVGSLKSARISFRPKVDGQRGRNFMMLAVRQVYVKEGL